MLVDEQFPSLREVRPRLRYLIVAIVITPVVVIGAYEYFRAATPQHLTITSGAEGGIYAVVGDELAAILSRNLGVEVGSRRSQGSNENVARVDAGEANFGFAQDGLPTGGKVRALAHLYDSPLQIAVSQSSGIKSIRDLVHKTIFMGPPKSGTRAIAELVLKRYGIDPNTDISVSSASNLMDGANEMIAGRAQAGFFLLGLNSPSIEALAKTGRFDLLDLDRAKAIAAVLPVLSVVEIAPGSYATQWDFPSHPVHTIASHEILICSSSVPDRLAYKVLEALFRNSGPLVQQIPALAELSRIDPERNFFYPVHPGALVFYRREQIPPLINRANMFGAVGASLSLGTTIMFLFRRRWARNWLRKMEDIDRDIELDSKLSGIEDRIRAVEKDAFADYKRGIIGKENYELIVEYGRICRSRFAAKPTLHA